VVRPSVWSVAGRSGPRPSMRGAFGPDGQEGISLPPRAACSRGAFGPDGRSVPDVKCKRCSWSCVSMYKLLQYLQALQLRMRNTIGRVYRAAYGPDSRAPCRRLSRTQAYLPFTCLAAGGCHSCVNICSETTSRLARQQARWRRLARLRSLRIRDIWRQAVACGASNTHQAAYRLRSLPAARHRSSKGRMEAGFIEQPIGFDPSLAGLAGTQAGPLYLRPHDQQAQVRARRVRARRRKHTVRAECTSVSTR
jgi:hypothetical protein